VLKSKNTYEIMTPQSVGLKDNRMNLTSRSGSHMVKTRLADLGYDAADYDMQSIYAKFKALADKKGTVYDDDLITLMEASHDDMKDTYTLEYLNVSSGTGTVPTATVRITENGQKITPGSACGYGAVHAMTKAIDKIVGYKIKIDNFSIAAITEGQDALAKVTIQASASEGSFVGNGVSMDIVEASAFAYMDIINKIARMKKFGRKIKTVTIIDT
jgi:2-isopropylmalate synthase